MTYTICEPCIDVKDRACVDECPVDCIYEGGRMLYIHPDECVDCGACEPVCPVPAIFYEDDVPAEWKPPSEHSGNGASRAQASGPSPRLADSTRRWSSTTSVRSTTCCSRHSTRQVLAAWSATGRSPNPSPRFRSSWRKRLWSIER